MLIIENFFSSLEGAYAPNTIRSYRSDFEHYATWCYNINTILQILMKINLQTIFYRWVKV